MGQGLYRLKKKHLPTKKSHGEVAKTMDHFMYFIALIAPIMTIPQLTQVWVDKSVHGISIWTWGAYAFVSALWLVYGAIHKEKPMMLTQALLLVLDSSIVVGVLITR